MKISDILKAKGVFSKDIKIRLKNGQIRLNGDVIKEDIKITHMELSDMVNINDIIQDAGEFLAQNVVQNNIWIEQCIQFGLEDVFGLDIDNGLTKMLKNYNILKISKKELIVIRNY